MARQAPDVEFTTVGITVEARDALADLCRKRHGANVRDVASALVLWFTSQAAAVQTAILSGVDSGMEREYAAALRRLADELERKGGDDDEDIVIESTGLREQRSDAPAKPERPHGRSPVHASRGKPAGQAK